MLLKINMVAFILGDKNIAQCFSCGNNIHWKEGQDPLDKAFHNNCEYLRRVTIDAQVIYITSKHKLKKSVEVCFFNWGGGVACLFCLS